MQVLSFSISKEVVFAHSTREFNLQVEAARPLRHLSSFPSKQRTTMTILPLFSLVAGSVLLLQVNSLSIGRHGMPRFARMTTKIAMSSTTNTDSWAKLQSVASKTKVGSALDAESESRIKGTGAPFVQNNLRLFGTSGKPKLTLYRDHAGKFFRMILHGL